MKHMVELTPDEPAALTDEVTFFVDMFALSDDVRDAIAGEANAWLDQLEHIERLMAFEDECLAEEEEWWGREQRHFEEVMNR